MLPYEEQEPQNEVMGRRAQNKKTAGADKSLLDKSAASDRAEPSLEEKLKAYEERYEAQQNEILDLRQRLEESETRVLGAFDQGLDQIKMLIQPLTVKQETSTPQRLEDDPKSKKKPSFAGLEVPEESAQSKDSEADEMVSDDSIIHTGPSNLNNSLHPSSPSRARKYKRPQNFDGTSSWTSYLCHFETVSDYNKWNTQEKGSELATCMLGSALDLLVELPTADRQNYELIVAHMENFFNPVGGEMAHRAIFDSRTRKTGESPMEYGVALKSLATKAFPSLGVAGRDTLLKTQFLRGIGNTEMRKLITMQQPKSLEDAIALATQYHYLELAEKSAKTEPSKPRVAVVAQKAAVSGLEGQNSDMAQTLNELTNMVRLLVQTKSQPPTAPCPRCKQTGHWARECPTYKSSVYCYLCKQPGHFKRDCPQKTSEQKDVVSKNVIEQA